MGNGTFYGDGLNKNKGVAETASLSFELSSAQRLNSGPHVLK